MINALLNIVSPFMPALLIFLVARKIQRRNIHWLLEVCIYILFTAAYEVVQGALVWFVIPICILYAAAIFAVCDIPLLNAIYFGSILASYNFISFNFVMYPLSQMTGISHELLHEGYPLLRLLFETISSAIQLGSVLLYARKAPAVAEEHLSPIRLLPILVPLVIVQSSQIIAVEVDISVVPTMRLAMGAAICALQAAAYISIFTTSYIDATEISKAHLEKLNQANQIQYIKFLNRQLTEDSMRRLNHDLKNHLMMINNMTDAREVKDYVSEIYKEIKRTIGYFQTGNAVMDTLLAGKNEAAQKLDVSLIVFADFSCIGFVDGTDLCAIFGNALDNAIEAAARASGDDLRIVLLKAMQEDGVFVAKLTNHYTGEMIKRGKSFVSTKKGEGHGVGLSSIEYSAQKYGGVLSAKAEDGLFTLTVAIPLPEEP